MTQRSSIALMTLVCMGASVAQVRAQTTGTLTPATYLQVFDPATNVPVTGACIWTYAAGTTTPVATYNAKQLNGATQNPNPIIAAIDGTFVAYLTPGQSYKFVYEQTCVPPAHGASIRTQDNIDPVPGSASVTSVVGVAAVSIAAGQAVYLSDGGGGRTPGQWYLADNTNSYSSTTVLVGIAPQAIAAQASGTILLSGQVTGLSALTVGATYLVGTAGALTATAPAQNRRALGMADSATTLVLELSDFGGGINPPLTAPTVTDNQILIGATSTRTMTFATLTGGTGLTVTNAAGVVTLAAKSAVLDIVGAEQVVNNTAALTQVYSFAVPGGTLSTNRSIRLMLEGELANGSAGGSTFAVQVSYGGTNLTTTATPVQTNPVSATHEGLRLTCWLTAVGATNTQRSHCEVSSLSAGVLGNGQFGTSSTLAVAVHGALAVDSTVSQNLVVQVQHQTADATIIFRRWGVTTELLSP